MLENAASRNWKWLHERAAAQMCLLARLLAIAAATPETLRSARGVLDVPLTVQPTRLGDSWTRGYGSVPGPTLVVHPGDILRIHLKNDLIRPDSSWSENTYGHVNSTNLHVHGMHVSPLEDNVFRLCMPGETIVYEYHIGGDHPYMQAVSSTRRRFRQ